MKFDLKDIEKKIQSSIEEFIVGNMYEGTEFPMDLVDKPLKLVDELIISNLEKGLNIDVELEDLKNVLMVSIIDPINKAELLNVVYSVKRIDDYKIIVKDVLVSIKPYILNNYEEIIIKQNQYIENLIKSQIQQENDMLLNGASVEYLSEDEFKNINNE